MCLLLYFVSLIFYLLFFLAAVSLLFFDGFVGHPRFGCADAWVRSPAMLGPSWHQWFLFEQTCYKEHWWMVHITMGPILSELLPNAMSKLPSPEYLSAAFGGCSFKVVF